MKYQYCVHDLRSIVTAGRKPVVVDEKEVKAPKYGKETPDQVICIDFLNDMGSQGWKCISDPQGMVVYFEKTGD